MSFFASSLISDVIVPTIPDCLFYSKRYTIKVGDNPTNKSKLLNLNLNLNMPLPEKVNGNNSNFLKLENGQTRLLIVSPVLAGWRAWMQTGQPLIQREEFTQPVPGIRVKDVKDSTGNITGQVPEKPQFFWAAVVYNFKTAKFEVADFTQATVRKALKELEENPAWGDPMNRYSFTISKTGTGMTNTKYSVTPNPDTENEEIKGIVEKYKSETIDLEDQVFGQQEPDPGIVEPPATTPEGQPHTDPQNTEKAF